MHEIAKVTLENEMDLILAHKRSMKLAELAGLSLSAQTTFATAVSEVARNTIESGKSGCLLLNVETDRRDKYIVACVKDQKQAGRTGEGLEYAKRLVSKYSVSTQGEETSIELFYHIAPSFHIDINRLDEWRSFFRNDPPVSAYEELKRKNEQLQNLSEKVQKSEAQYKTLTNSLPLMIFSVDRNGRLLYANDWLYAYSNETVESLNANRWKKLVHADDYDAFILLLENHAPGEVSIRRTQVQLKDRSGEYLWHQLSLSPFYGGEAEPQYWIGYLADIHAQKAYEETLKDNLELKQAQATLRENQKTLEKYIDELNRSNQELQQFAFVASHDLQEPVRKLMFYSDYMVNQHSGSLEARSVEYLKTMQRSARRMRVLIKDLLVYSQIKREEIGFSPVDLNNTANEVLQDFEIAIEEKKALCTVENLPTIQGDARMMEQLFQNLFSNSLKYSKPEKRPEIRISSSINEDHIELKFQDNGIGFNEKHLPQMFTLFQRLHNRSAYEGTGLGLAICKKIVDLHNGSIWARSEEGQGASFYVSLPLNPRRV